MAAEPVCTSFSSVLPPNQISRCYDANNQSDINIFPPIQQQGGDQYYVCIDSYSFTLKLFPLHEDPLATWIVKERSGVLCVTMTRKTEDDHEQDVLTKFECIYPKNVINGKNNGRIKDVILIQDGYNIMNDAKFMDGPGTLNLHNRNIRNPIYYSLPKDMYDNDLECQRVTFNAYIRDNTYPPHYNYNALFDPSTGKPSRILIDSIIKIRICNFAYIQQTNRHTETSDSNMYLLGSCDTGMTVANTQYPFKLNFMYSGADSSESSVITRTDLRLDPDKVWEIAVQKITYSTSNKIKIPSPSSAKQQGIYDLYAGEILVSGPEFYPIGRDQRGSETRQDILDIIVEIHKVPKVKHEEIRSFVDQLYGHFLKCRQGITDLFHSDYTEKHLFINLWYNRDLMDRFDASSYETRAPIFRWNYIDVLFKKYPQRFASNNGEFGLFTLREIVQVEIISKDQKTNAQRWATSTAVVPGHSPLKGYIHRPVIRDPRGIQRDWYAEIGNGIPIFEVLDETNRALYVDNRKFSVVIYPQYTTKYVAVGSKIRKLFGYSPLRRTPPRKSEVYPYNITRGQLDIIYDNERESFITPCSLTPIIKDTDIGLSMFGLKTRGHVVDKCALWSLPKLFSYEGDGEEYRTLPVKPLQVFSNTVLDVYGADELLIYTNILPNATHIGDNLSPLLVRAPCPSYKFGISRMYDGEWTVQHRTWDVENLEYKTLLPNANLDDMYVTVSNSYGDVVYTGVLEIQLVIREKNSSDPGPLC